MKENRYDDQGFFEQYSRMDRSVKGLSAAGEWERLKKMLPNFYGKRVLDLGCGFGWHCGYAVSKGAAQVVGIDISRKMLEQAMERNRAPQITYQCVPIEDYEYKPASFDVVLSSLAFHYLRSFDDICKKVYRALSPGGDFVFSVEHPVFTAEGSQGWFCDEAGKTLHWPVDRYFTQGRRDAVFLGERVVKYHKTLTAYVNGLLAAGFQLTGLVEPEPSQELRRLNPQMEEELRRPMMLLLSAKKPV